MIKKPFRISLLASSVAFALGGANAVLAAESNEQAKDDDNDNKVVVVGIRDSLKENLAKKRDAIAVVDIITPEDIGKFPDKNIAESLQRVPGVSINRGFAGEGNEVSIRGVDPELTQTLVNGQFVASTNWFSLSFNKRSFNMDLLPSEVVQSVEVYKSPEASLDEGGVGGTVVVTTRKPLDLDRNTVFASAEIMKNSLASDTAPTVNALYSWKNDQENFGFMASFSKAETIGRGNKAENYWEEAWSASGISQFRQDRERDMVDVDVQFAANDRLDFNLHYFKTELDATNTNQNFLVFGGCCDTASGQSTFTGGTNGTSPSTGIPMAGTLVGGSGNPGWAGWLLAQDVNSRKPKLKTDITDFTVDYSGDTYSVHASIGSTSASGGNGGNVNSLWGIDDDDSRWVENGGNLSVDFDFTRNAGMFVDVNGLDMADPSWQTNRAMSLSEVELWDDEDWAQVDVDFDVEWGHIEKIRLGFKTRDHVFGKVQTDSTVDTAAVLAGATTLGNSAYTGSTIDVGGVMSGGSDTQIAGVSDAFDSAVRANVTASVYRYDTFGEVEEDISAIYAQADFSGDNYRGNFGFRYVTTDVSGKTFATANDPNSGFTRDADYSDFLPSVNFVYDLEEDLLLRLSAAKVMSRPAYGTLNPALSSINPTSNTASSGNVAMDPFRATQFDAGLEWYFADNSFLGAAFFLKDIDSFVTSGTVQDLVFELNGDQNAPNDLEPYTLSVPVAGKGGSIKGLEINYQQTFGAFGVLANVTLSDGEGDTEDGNTIDLPGNSDLSYNLSGFYQDDIIEARLTYTYRDDYLAEGTALAGSLDVFDAQAYLDGSITWHVTDTFDLSLQGVNLLKEQTVQRHGAGSLGTPRVTTENGARYFLKASVRF